jgi:hypothetical protein
LNLPPDWAATDMERLDPQVDYSSMRKQLLDGDWQALCKASPWQWMLALIGLLDVGLPQAFDLSDLMLVYQALAQWQTLPANGGREKESAAEQEAIWPFDALPTFSQQRCDEVMAALPKALYALDALRGMHVVNKHGQKFGRHPHTDEFTDASGASWQMSSDLLVAASSRCGQKHVALLTMNYWPSIRSTTSLANGSGLKISRLWHRRPQFRHPTGMSASLFSGTWLLKWRRCRPQILHLAKSRKRSRVVKLLSRTCLRPLMWCGLCTWENGKKTRGASDSV